MALQRINNIIVWPNHVKPNALLFTITQPTSVSRAQNGKKYVRSWDFTGYGLEVSYPPMTATQFQPFQAAILALNGQANVCWFDLLGTNSEKMIFPYLGDSDWPALVDSDHSIATGAMIRDVRIKGLTALAEEPIPAGSMISGLGRNYGHVQFVTNCTDADSNGISTITLADPLAESVSNNDPIDLDPQRVLVSLADDSRNINLQAARLYGFNVVFEFDRTYGS